MTKQTKKTAKKSNTETHDGTASGITALIQRLNDKLDNLPRSYVGYYDADRDPGRIIDDGGGSTDFVGTVDNVRVPRHTHEVTITVKKLRPLT